MKWSRIQIRDFCNEMINVRRSIFFLYVHLFTWTGCVGSHASVILKCSSTKCDHFLTEQLIQNLLITTTWQLVPSFVLTKTNSVHVLIYFSFHLTLRNLKIMYVISCINGVLLKDKYYTESLLKRYSADRPKLV